MIRETQWDVLVVGAGPAGLMAAGTAGGRGRKTLLFDKNSQVGKKLRITGKGRCNVTNDSTLEELIAATPRGGKFLYGSFSAFPPQAVMEFFQSLGVPLKVERGRRVFPQSDSAQDVADALEVYVKNQGVTVVQERVLHLLREGDRVVGVVTDKGTYRGESVILACGGASYPGTGSNGEGYRLASSVGHTVVPPTPSLVPLVEQGDICPRLQGLSLRNVGVTVEAQGKKKPVYEDFGELLFTHFGLSGPTILSASAHLHPMVPDFFTVHIDLKPALDPAQLDRRILRDFEQNKNKNFANSLHALLPQTLIPVVVELCGIGPEVCCHSVTREERGRLCALLKDFTVKVKGFRPLGEAIVTSGGVKLSEIHPKTLASKVAPGLFVAGELLDCDAYTGGFNLQIAFSTGYCAGMSA